jgi:hypothetical protein
MATIVKKVVYFAMDVPNRAGQGAKIMGALAGQGVNLLAFSGFPNKGKAQLDFIPDNAAAFKKAVKEAKLTTRPQKFGFLVQGDDRKGAVAKLLKKLAEKKINITAIDAVSAGAARYAAILFVAQKDVNKAARALKAR